MSSLAPSLTPPKGVALLRAPQAWLGNRGMMVVSVLQALAGLALSATGLRFDGAVDIHRTWQGEAVPWTLALVDQIAAWPVATAAVWVILRLWRQPVAISALLWTLGLARVALVLVAPLILAVPTPSALTPFFPGQAIAPPASMLFAGIGTLVGVVWFVMLVVSGLRRLTDARGKQLALITLSALVVAEIASKLVIAVAG